MKNSYIADRRQCRVSTKWQDRDLIWWHWGPLFTNFNVRIFKRVSEGPQVKVCNLRTLERIENLTEVCKDFQFPTVEYPYIGKEKTYKSIRLLMTKYLMAHMKAVIQPTFFYMKTERSFRLRIKIASKLSHLKQTF